MGKLSALHELMSKDLSLNKTQKEKLKSALKNFETQAKDLRKKIKAGGDKASLKQKGKETLKELRKVIAGSLDQKQKKTYASKKEAYKKMLRG